MKEGSVEAALQKAKLQRQTAFGVIENLQRGQPLSQPDAVILGTYSQACRLFLTQEMPRYEYDGVLESMHRRFGDLSSLVFQEYCTAEILRTLVMENRKCA